MKNRKAKYNNGNMEKNHNITIIICISIIVAIFVGIMIASISSDNSEHRNKDLFPTTATSKKQSDSNTIQSVYFKQFVSAVFGKDYSQVTPEELAEITCINLKDSLYQVSYRRKDGELQYVEMFDSKGINYSDLKAFTGLKSLAIQNNSKFSEFLPLLENLEELKCRTSPKMLLKYIKHPEKIKSLECYVDEEELGEIDKFCNLEKLKLDIYISSIRNKEKPDLSSIGNLTLLEDLWIEASEYTFFPFISSLTNLKSLNLHCKNLRDLSFLEHTPKLEALTLYDTDILNLDALKYVPKLKVLRLNDCNEVPDYNIVTTFTELEELMLSYYYKQQLPEDFDKLTKVNILTLDGFNDIGFLSQFPNVKKLDLYGCNYSKLYSIACMKELEELRVGAGTNLFGLGFLKELEKLSKVQFYGTRLATDTEQLFMIPNLKELDLGNNEITIDFNGIEENESLENINLDNIKWSGYNDDRYAEQKKYSYENWEVLDMNKCIDFLKCFPNLKYLSLEGNKLQNIAFLENMQKLEYLNITNNYVVDIQPLNELKKLKKVLCGENPLDKQKKLDERINVNYDSKGKKLFPFVNYEF